MIEDKLYMTVFVVIFPSLGVIIGCLLIFKLLEVIQQMLESKFTTAIKRIVSVNIIDSDVYFLEKLLKEYIKISKIVDEGEIDRRLIGFANKFIDSIDQQRTQIKILEEEDRKKELEELMKSYGESEIIELTSPIDSKG